MASAYKTPGVYIQEKNAFPASAVAVETAVPVFTGYTEKAIRNGNQLLHEPVFISSFAEYTELFGGGFHAQFKIADATPANKKTFKINNADKVITINKNNRLYFYNTIRLFFINGGGNCYILSVGTYGGVKPGEGLQVKKEDFIGSSTTTTNIFSILEKEADPTLIVIPDIVAFENPADAYDLYAQVLLHCQKTQSRFGIFDVITDGNTTVANDIKAFRDAIGTDALNYGAAYYPWLNTSIVTETEVDFTNLDASADLTTLLPEAQAKTIAATIKTIDASVKDDIAALPDKEYKNLNEEQQKQVAESKRKEIIGNIHQLLKAASTTYVSILNEIRTYLNLLPPSGAMAGIYTMTDNTRGVWEAPANVSVASVDAPSINISQEEQAGLNVDATSGKSINVIRSFPGIGTLVWGARTLDGNSQDWRYINVRRTMIMIEQSIKLATTAYVFEPNDAGTWVAVSNMINNFLLNLWKQGALTGAKPEQAYNVQVALGSTMTANDILEGIMRVTVSVAMVHPAEFIVITFQQQQQQS